MSEYTSTGTQGQLTVKLWRGERMCLLGMDVADPEPDFAGFSIEVRSPGSPDFKPLRNRLAFAYPAGKAPSLNQERQFPSLQAPFQKFRWVHFPYDPQPGSYTYRVTRQHMRADNVLTAGDSVTLSIALDRKVYNGFLEVGFTRGYASSQAFTDKYGNHPEFFPKSVDGPGFDKSKAPAGAYAWLGFEALELLAGMLRDAAADPALTLDVLAYDLDEPDLIAGLGKLGARLRIVIDNSGTHGPAGSSASQAAATLAAAGAQVHRMHFAGLQHNKVLILKRDGVPVKVLGGSTNFSFNGLYLQSNNALVFESGEIARLFADYFDAAWSDPAHWSGSPAAGQWHAFHTGGAPKVEVCLSPHTDPALSLAPVAAAIDGASSSVLFAIAFLNQTSTSGLVRSAIDRLTSKPLFSYGISDKASGLAVKKPDGSEGIVDWNYLKQAPPPFNAEWSSGAGIHEHNKFVVVDFNLPTAKVFTGSSNLSESGEKGNGDHLLLIRDPRVATAYAIQAILIFDHLHFALKMNQAAHPAQLALQKPLALAPAEHAWFDRYYVPGSQMSHDRELFSH